MARRCTIPQRLPPDSDQGDGARTGDVKRAGCDLDQLLAATKEIPMTDSWFHLISNVPKTRGAYSHVVRDDGFAVRHTASSRRPGRRFPAGARRYRGRKPIRFSPNIERALATRGRFRSGGVRPILPDVSSATTRHVTELRQPILRRTASRSGTACRSERTWPAAPSSRSDISRGAGDRPDRVQQRLKYRQCRNLIQERGGRMAAVAIRAYRRNIPQK